jgi:hypothetical protein
MLLWLNAMIAAAHQQGSRSVAGIVAMLPHAKDAVGLLTVDQRLDAPRIRLLPACIDTVLYRTYAACPHSSGAVT